MIYNINKSNNYKTKIINLKYNINIYLKFLYIFFVII